MLYNVGLLYRAWQRAPRYRNNCETAIVHLRRAERGAARWYRREMVRNEHVLRMTYTSGRYRATIAFVWPPLRPRRARCCACAVIATRLLNDDTRLFARYDIHAHCNIT